MRAASVRVLVALTLFGLALGGGVAQSAAAAPAGWRLVASDDFTGSQLGSVWGEYGGAYETGANAWSADEVSVSGGTLRVRMEHKTSHGKPYTSGGVGMWGLAQTYGRYEFQAMAPAVPGIDSYITLWPPDADGEPNSMLVELLDKPAVSPGVQAAYVTINYGSGKSDQTVPGSYCGGFHDYVIEWTPTYESVSVDGRVLLKSPGATSVKRWIGFVMSNGDTLTGTPSASALPAEFDIRHLRVYAYSPGAPAGTPSAPASTTSRSPTSATTSSKPSSSAATSSAKPTPSLSAQPPPSVPSTPALSPQPTASTSTSTQSAPPTNQSIAAAAHSSWHGPLFVASGLIGAAVLGFGVFTRRPRGRRRNR
ncbi:MAG: family 16 glycosylhydrolase [Catenulisporales bacterium]|nr:family 16 glycosylhydrolase [Catenulisporales bacterium]